LLAVVLQSVEFWVSGFGLVSLPKYLLLFTLLSTLRILLSDVETCEIARGDSLPPPFSPTVVNVVGYINEELQSTTMIV
jgi:hypothetical protein